MAKKKKKKPTTCTLETSQWNKTLLHAEVCYINRPVLEGWWSPVARPSVSASPLGSSGMSLEGPGQVSNCGKKINSTLKHNKCLYIEIFVICLVALLLHVNVFSLFLWEVCGWRLHWRHMEFNRGKKFKSISVFNQVSLFAHKNERKRDYFLIHHFPTTFNILLMTKSRRSRSNIEAVETCDAKMWQLHRAAPKIRLG